MPIGFKIFIIIFGIVWLSIFAFIVVNGFKNFKQNIEKAKNGKEMQEKTNALLDENCGENEQKQNCKKTVICPYCKTKNNANESECKNCGANL